MKRLRALAKASGIESPDSLDYRAASKIARMQRARFSWQFPVVILVTIFLLLLVLTVNSSRAGLQNAYTGHWQ